MTTIADPARVNLQRDITEALLRLRLARAERDRKEAEVCAQRLDWLLDRFAAHMRSEQDA